MANDDIAMNRLFPNVEGTFRLFEWDLKQFADWGEWKLPLVIWMWKGWWKIFHIWLTNEWTASGMSNEVRSCIDELPTQWIGCVGIMAYGIDISSSKNVYWLPWIGGSMVHWPVGISIPFCMVSYTIRWKGIFMSYFLLDDMQAHYIVVWENTIDSGKP
jgi:hypothetical protein